MLQEKFKVAAVLNYKHNGHFDILVDEGTFDYRRARASFSIAHELGHIILHSEVCRNCRTIDDAINLMKRLKRAYWFIEKAANYFAGAILMPSRTLIEDTAKIYEVLVKEYGYDTNLIPDRLCSTLARRYEVYIPPMRIRLKELNLNRKITTALCSNSPYLDL